MDPERRKRFLRAAGWILAAIVLARVGASLLEGLRQLRQQPDVSHPRWGLIALSGLVFLVAHATLVLTWRAVLSTWNAHLAFWTAARIWSVSNLGRYIPGKVWQVGAMGAMARQVDVSPVAASASALLGTLVNILAGFAVSLVSGRVLLDRSAGGGGSITALLVGIAAVALVLTPVLLPRVTPVIARLLNRPVQATLPVMAVVYSIVGNIAAWLLYGAAFELFVSGVVGDSIGPYSAYLAVYTISYVVGYIVLFAPAGLGVREGAMLQLLQAAGLATYPQATLITIASRVWLTLLEVTPALLFWAFHHARSRPPSIETSDLTH